MEDKRIGEEYVEMDDKRIDGDGVLRFRYLE
jgi:leucyl aminopeptidase (aminopeptidase T)